MERKVKRDSKKSPEYLSANICSGFQRELLDLIERLPENPKNDYLRAEVTSKYLDPKLVRPDVRQAAAIQKWMVAEASNGKTNMRLLLGETNFGWTTSDRLLSVTRAFIADILGPVPLELQGIHTNGASTRIRRGSDAAILKHADGAHCSHSAFQHWRAYAINNRLNSLPVKRQDCSVLFTVPKKTNIDRVACKEPEINMFLQRPFGSHIRSRLKRVGINLNDQTKNQSLAESALKAGLATVDLTSASDTISHQLVFELLPFEWFSVLDDLRSHFVKLPNGELHRLEMFSSMGNGFTFELESLIFLALTRAICYLSGIKGVISVYGDDIICPNEVVPRLSRTFHWLGFSLNMKKTNHTGLFRESCGAHFHNGSCITPFYLRESVKKKTDVIRLLNRLLRWSAPYGFPYSFDQDVVTFHDKWKAVIPKILHGGDDLDSVAQLVTDDTSHSAMMSLSEDHETDESLALEFWLTMTDSREWSETTTRCKDLPNDVYRALGLNKVPLFPTVKPTKVRRTIVRRLSEVCDMLEILRE